MVITDRTGALTAYSRVTGLFLSFQAPGNEWISPSYFRQYTLLLNGLEILTRFCGGLRTHGFQEKG
jgi:hypothetical protein